MIYTVLGYDKNHSARAVEVAGIKEEIKEMLEKQGWTDILFLE